MKKKIHRKKFIPKWKVLHVMWNVIYKYVYFEKIID